MEDVELCLRARARGFRTICDNSIFVGHAGSRSFGAEKAARGKVAAKPARANARPAKPARMPQRVAVSHYNNADFESGLRAYAQYRDLGIVAAPLLLLSVVTGTMMIFQPFAMAMIAPFGSPAAAARAMKPPKYASGPLAAQPDYAAMLTEARRRFPDAEFRILSLPRKAGDPIMLRMRQQAEWLPNGRSTLWFDAATGKLLGARDALAMPSGAQAFNKAFPIHAAKIGGLPWRLVMTISGLSLTMLGSFAVWTFWFRRPKPAKRVVKKAMLAT